MTIPQGVEAIRSEVSSQGVASTPAVGVASLVVIARASQYSPLLRRLGFNPVSLG